MKSWREVENQLEKFDKKLEEHNKTFEGALIGQTSLWYHAENENHPIEERETDDIDVVPYEGGLMAALDTLEGNLTRGGYRAKLGNEYIDILSGHPNAEEMVDENNHYDTIDNYDNIKLHVIDKDLFIEDKSGLEEDKHREDIEKMKEIYNMEY